MNHCIGEIGGGKSVVINEGMMCTRKRQKNVNEQNQDICLLAKAVVADSAEENIAAWTHAMQTFVAAEALFFAVYQ